MARKSIILKNFHSLSEVKGTKLVHINIRSLPKKIDQLRIMLQNSAMDVLTISETLLKDGLVDKLYDLDGYKMFRYDRKTSVRCSKKGSRGAIKRGGGLVTYVHNAGPPQHFNHAPGGPMGKNTPSPLQRRYCREHIQAPGWKPSTSVFLMGDLNVDYKNKSSPDYKKLNFLIKSNGLSQLITQTTRNTDKSKSLLDIILTNSKYISEAGILDHFISDHQPVYVVKKKKRDSRQKKRKVGMSSTL